MPWDLSYQPGREREVGNFGHHVALDPNVTF